MKLILALSLLFASGVLSHEALAYPNENETSTWQVEGYKPNYFLLGDKDAKLNISFKMPLLNEVDLYMGYSQSMIWRLYEYSSPFEDVNYNPEIFYRYYVKDKPFTWIDVGLYEHESNGQGGELSRGWNRFYILYSAEAMSFTKAKIYWSFKAWLPYNVEETNDDLVEYRGHYESSLTVDSFLGDFFQRSDLTLRLFAGGRAGMDPTNGGQELTLRLKGPLTKALSPVVTFQIFNGYAESLMSYNKKETEFRIGIGF